MGPHVALDKGAELLSCTERIARNPVAFDRLCSDPLGELERCGVQVDTKLIKELVGLPGAADADLLDLVRTRAAATGTADVLTALDFPHTDERFRRICEDAKGGLEAVGLHVDAQLIKSLLRVEWAPDADLLQMLPARTSRFLMDCGDCN